jgi:hypothetical protein
MSASPLEFWFSKDTNLAIPANCAWIAKKRHGEISENTTFEEFLVQYKDHIIDVSK